MAGPVITPTGGRGLISRLGEWVGERQAAKNAAIAAGKSAESNGIVKSIVLGIASTATAAVVFLGVSSWAANNQKEEASKERPWENPSKATSMLTTSSVGLKDLIDSDLSDGHKIIKGIYSEWKARQVAFDQQEIAVGRPPRSIWNHYIKNPKEISKLPELWQKEFNNDLLAVAGTIDATNQSLVNNNATQDALNQEKLLQAAADAASTAQARQQARQEAVTAIADSGAALGLRTEGELYKAYNAETLAKYIERKGLLARDKTAVGLSDAFTEVAHAAKHERLLPKDLASAVTNPEVLAQIDPAKQSTFKREIETLALELK